MRSSVGGHVGKNTGCSPSQTSLSSSCLGVVDALAGSPVVVGMLYGLAVLIPGIAGTVRKLHDTDWSGWRFLIALVPLIGIIVLIVFTVQDGTPRENKYGANPKTETA